MSKTMKRDAMLALEGIDGLTGEGADDVIYISHNERMALQRESTAVWRRLLDRIAAPPDQDHELDAPVPIEVGANLKASTPRGIL